MPLLSAHELRKTYGGLAAVNGVSLAVEPGEIRAVIGPNGAGKSTLFDLLSGWIRPDGGTVRFADRDVTGWPAERLARSGMGRSFQRSNPFLGLTVLENVLAAILIRQGDGRRFWRGLAQYRAERERAMAVLTEIGLAGQAAQPARSLSYGDQKRLDMAITLALEPILLILDEPLAGVAPEERGSLVQLIRWMAREKGKSVILSEHDVDAVMMLADRVTVLSGGEVLAEGSPDEVAGDPSVRSAFLGN